MKFIEAKQVPEVETVVHLVVASSDTRHSVATAADLELRSKQRSVKAFVLSTITYICCAISSMEILFTFFLRQCIFIRLGQIEILEIQTLID